MFSTVRRLSPDSAPVRPKLHARNEAGARSRFLASFAFLAALIVPAGAHADLDVGVRLEPETPTPGEQFVVEITVSNPDPLQALGVVVSIDIPTGIDSFGNSTVIPSGGCASISCEAGETLIVDLDTIGIGKSKIITFAPTVSAGTAPGTIIFPVTVAATGAIDIEFDLDTVVSDLGAFEMLLVESANPVAVADEIAYAVVIGHRAAARFAVDTALTFSAAPGTTVLSASDGGTIGAGMVTWDLGTLSPAQTVVRHVTVSVDAGASDGTLLVASAGVVDASVPSASTIASSVVRVQAADKLQLAIDPSLDPALVGERIELVMTASNLDLLSSTDTQIDFRWPTGFASLSDSLLDGGDCPSISCEIGENGVWAIGDISSGDSTNFVVPPVIADIAAGSLIDLTAHMTSASGESTTSRAAIVVSAEGAYELIISTDDDPVSAGDEIVYTVDFSHRSATRFATGAMLAFHAPAGITVASATAGGSVDGNDVTWDLGTLAPGQAGRGTVTVTVDGALADGTLLKSRAAIFDTADPAEQGRTQSTGRIAGDIDLDFQLEVAPNPAQPGERVQVVMTVSNRGLLPSPGTQVTLFYPQELASLSESNIVEGDCPSISCEGGEALVFDLGEIGSGDARTVSLPPSVGMLVSGSSVELFARAENAAGDIATARDVLQVDDVSAFELIIAPDRNPVAAGDQVIYTVSFGHRAEARVAPDASLAFTLPEGAVFVSASDGGTESGGIVTWAVGTLTPGMSGKRTVTVALDGALAEGSLEVAHATIVDTDDPPASSEISNVLRIESGITVETAIQATPDPAKPDEEMLVQLMATNTGLLPLIDVVVELAYPTEFGSVGETENIGLDCNSIACEPGETAFFVLGDIPAGEGRSVAFYPRIAALSDARVIDLFVRVRDASDTQSIARSALVIDAARGLDLRLGMAADPVATDESVVLTATFGNSRTDTTSTGTMLLVRLPEGATVTSSSAGADVGEPFVLWDLGELTVGESGRRQLTFDKAGLAEGEILEATAIIFDDLDPMNEARANAVARVQDDARFDVVMSVEPDATFAGDEVTVTVMVTNNDLLGAIDTVVDLHLPETFASFSDAGDPTLECSSISCEGRENARFSLGTIDAGGTAMAEFTTTITTGSKIPTNGTVVRIEAIVSEAGGDQSPGSITLRIGPNCADTNSDGSVTATDSLFILNVAVGLGECETVICDLDGNGTTTASDALAALLIAVGLDAGAICGPLG